MAADCLKPLAVSRCRAALVNWYYDAETAGWQLEACRYRFRVGQSSADLPLEAEWAFGAEGWRETRREQT